MEQVKVAVIGAGVSGLACARQLLQAGADVTVFEKSRGPGGRAPTRWLSRESDPPVGIDHGTQYFYAEDPRFRAVVLEAQKSRAVAPWMGRVVDLAYGDVTDHPSDSARWVGVPGMNALGAYLGKGLNVLKQHRVTALSKESDGWQLTVMKGDGEEPAFFNAFDFVVTAIPAEQTVVLFSAVHPGLASLASQVTSNVTWALMISLCEPLGMGFDGAFVHDSPAGWLCRDSSKPGRAAGERWLLQATADWSLAHVNEPSEAVTQALLDVFRNVTGRQVEPESVQIHRWLYSLPANPLGQGRYVDLSLGLGACGDWLSGGSIESAFLSGLELGQSLVNNLPQRA